MAKKTKKNVWFNSTIAVLLIVFLGSVAVGLWRYGWEVVLDESLKYIIGASFTALVIALVGFAFRKELKRWFK